MTPFEAAWAEIQSRQPRGQFLGGSTGARGFDLDPGRFVGKRGNHPRHVLNEFDMNRYLSAMGVGVPNAALFHDDAGPMMLTQFQQGRHVNPQTDRQKVADDMLAHALIGNWDVTGMANDNALMLPSGQVSYVDVGGSGPWRAQGAPKGDQWGQYVNETETLRRRNPWYADVEDEDIQEQYNRMGGQYGLLTGLNQVNWNDPNTRDMLQRRIMSLQPWLG